MNIFVDHEGAEVDRLAGVAIRNPTQENIDKAIDAALKHADKLTEYIINGNRVP